MAQACEHRGRDLADVGRRSAECALFALRSDRRRALCPMSAADVWRLLRAHRGRCDDVRRMSRVREARRQVAHRGVWGAPVVAGRDHRCAGSGRGAAGPAPTL